jgi:hypothetical protein
LKFSNGVDIVERMSGKELGENRKFKMAARGSFSTTVATKKVLLFSYHVRILLKVRKCHV